MRITYDPKKRAETIANGGLDFDEAPALFAGDTLWIEDDRKDYGELRWQTVGWLRGSLVMVVWTERGDARHIISMRKCNDREKTKYEARLDRPG